MAARFNASEIFLELIKNGANINDNIDINYESVLDILLKSKRMNEFAGIPRNRARYLPETDIMDAIQVRHYSIAFTYKIIIFKLFEICNQIIYIYIYLESIEVLHSKSIS